MSGCLRKLNHAEHKSVHIQDSFWSPKLELIQTTTLWDIIRKFESDHEEGITKKL